MSSLAIAHGEAPQPVCSLEPYACTLPLALALPGKGCWVVCSEPGLSRVHEAARSTGAWVMLAGHPLHASALVDLSCWPRGSEGSTGPSHPCPSMSQPRLSVVRGCWGLELVECEVRSRRCSPELGGQGCTHPLHPQSPTHHLCQSRT